MYIYYLSFECWRAEMDLNFFFWVLVEIFQYEMNFLQIFQTERSDGRNCVENSLNVEKNSNKKSQQAQGKKLPV